MRISVSPPWKLLLDNVFTACGSRSLIVTFAIFGVTVAGTLCTRADQQIYTDSLQSSWQDWSWATVNLNVSSPRHSGSRSISVVADGWEALSLWHSPQDARAFTAFSFWIHGGSSGGQTLRVYAETESGGAKPAVSIAAPVAGSWRQVTLSLDSLGVAGMTDMTRFNIQNALGTTLPTFYIDDVSLISDTTPPTVQSVSPAPGAVSILTSVTVTFSESVTGVGAGDLRVNGNPALTVSGSDQTYTFTFAQPLEGVVTMSWYSGHGITDYSVPPNEFDETGPGATWQYTLSDDIPPVVTLLFPSGGSQIASLTQIEVTFSETVLGVQASDLRINGSPAANLTQLPGQPYVFAFPQPPTGAVSVAWAPGHGITDAATTPNPFAGGAWNYMLDPSLPLPDLVINEILCSSVNTNMLADEDGQLQDWIEIYNRGSQAVDLANWSLSDDPALPGLWTFPACTLAPGQFLVVFASGKDRRSTNSAAPLHTNFKLSGSGEYLGLYYPDSPRRLISGFDPYPEQRNDMSYGRDLLGALRYFATPSPGVANGMSSIVGVVEPLHANVNRGYFITPFTLILSCATPGATLRYTIDGSEPTASSPVFPASLTVSNTMLFRAAGFKTDHLPSRPITHSYLFNLPESIRSLPIVSIVTDSNHLWGPTGIVGIGPGYRNVEEHGAAWERPTSVEWIEPEDNGGFQIDCGIRVQGSDYNRENVTAESKFSFRLYFRGDYGPGRLEYPLFSETTLDRFDGLVLRAGMNEQGDPFIRDELHRRLSADMGQVASHGNMAIVLLNGAYYNNPLQPWILPVYNPCERVHSEFFQAYLGGSDQWDVVKPPWQVGGGAVDGTFANMQSLVDYVYNTADVTQQSDYITIAAWLDLTNFVDYLLLNTYAGMGDWPANNWRAGRDQSGGAWRFVVWDAEWGMGIYDRSPFTINSFTDTGAGLGNEWSEIGRLYRKLRTSAEFRLLWADRVQKHFYNGGVLTGQHITNRFDELKNELSQIIPTMNVSILNWVRDRSSTYWSQMNSQGLLSSIVAPGYNQFGGRVSAGFNLVITNVTGTIYYTTDGSDPRVPFTGAVSPSATAYSGPITLNSTVTVRARSRQSTTWSALTEATFTVGSLGIPLRITEIMYNPASGSLYEFIELQNTGTTPVNLGGMYFDGITFLFPEGSTLASNARLVLGSNTDTNAWKSLYAGVNAFGWFAGSLNNGGERITLFDRSGNIITSADYKDNDGWPTAADGAGASLEIIDPTADPDDPANWKASAQVNGSPGAVNSVPPTPAVYLNEIMADNVSAVNHSGTYPDWVELYNPGASAVNIAGWSLSDDGNARKFVFPGGTTVPALGYLVVWCDDVTNATPGLHAGFALSREGESVFLYNSATSRVDAISLGLQLPNYSAGRISGAWTLTAPTPNAANSAVSLASSTNLAINEWMANPAPGVDDWLELYNRSASMPMSLDGIYLATSNGLHQVNALSFLPPLGHVQLIADEGVGPGHLDFVLPASGGVIVLSDAAGGEIQSVVYGAQTEGVSQGRLPDGTSTIVPFPGTASPGAMNYVATYSGAVLNEVLARNKSVPISGAVRDFIELRNPNASSFNLGGMSLSVDSPKAGQWIFPPNTMLAANAYLVIPCDASRPASTNAGSYNLGDSLNGESGGAYLFNAAGQLVNSVEYGFQIDDLSIGVSGGQWRLLSAPTPGTANSAAAVLATNAVLRLNEWMATSDDGADWFELFNPTNRPVDLSTLSLSDDPSLIGQSKFRPGALSFIGPGGFAKWVADSSAGEGRDHVNFALNDAGETILIYGVNGSTYTPVHGVAFGAQSLGVSAGSLPDGSAVMVTFPETPTPGDSNYRLLSNVVISEALAHTDPPLEDAIELHNPTASPVNIGGWYLSNNKDVRRKYQIPGGTTIPANGYLVLYQYQFDNGTTNAFSLNSAHGDQIWLSATASGVETGERAHAEFGASFNGISFGRFATSIGADFVPLTQRTFGVDNPSTLTQFRTGTGLPNADAIVGPIVINELLYNPPGGTNGSDEYIELYNISSVTVPLYDPAHATNHWKLGGGIDYTFPAGVSLPAGGCLLVVEFDPVANPGALADFRARYGIAAALPVYGPFSGALDNAADTVELYRPDTPQQPPDTEAGFVPYVLADRVSYTDTAPWPTGDVDGGGLSLQKLEPDLYGNDPLHWEGGTPTPGSAEGSDLTDTDGDGIPDTAEEEMDLNPNDPTDAGLDPDADGLNNYQEYLAGTDHLDHDSTFKLQSFRVGSNTVLNFDAVVDRSYSIVYKDSLDNPAWLTLTNLPVQFTSQPVFVTNSHVGLSKRFYRLVTPALQ